MLTKQLSIAISIGISIGSGMARSDLKMLAAAPTTETRIDFDQVFAAATQQSEFNLSIHDRLRHVGTVDGSRKSDRLPNFTSVLPEPALLPYCEPVASPFADPILGRIVGRCDASVGRTSRPRPCGRGLATAQ
jgi:hypothetical protein